MNKSIWMGWSLVFGLGMACTNPATQLIVVIDSDIPDLEAVNVELLAPPPALPGPPLVEDTFLIGDDTRLPFSFGVSPPENDSDQEITIVARARVDDVNEALLTVRAVTGFEEEKTLRLFLPLTAACIDVSCGPMDTCFVGGDCERQQVPAEDLEEVAPEEEFQDLPILDPEPTCEMNEDCTDRFECLGILGCDCRMTMDGRRCVPRCDMDNRCPEENPDMPRFMCNRDGLCIPRS